MQSPKPEWNAEDYAKNSSAQLQWAQELIEKLSLRGHESLVDIGCGDGKVTAGIAQILTNGSVLGIDASPSMIELASERFSSQSHPNLAFLLMDATDIRLSRRFDVAFSSAALHWVQDQIAVLKGVHACLKPGGRILFQMGGFGNAAEVFEAIDSVLERPRWQRYFVDFPSPYHFYGPEQYENWLYETEFRAVRVELIPKQMRHQDTEAMRGWLRTTWFPYTDRVPVELRDSLLTEVVQTYAATHPADANGAMYVKMVRLEVEAYTL